jgi:Ca2+/H+ antiporter
MIVPSFLVGMFVGPQILIGAIVHALVAVYLFLARRGIIQQKKWAFTLLFLLGLFGLAAFPAAFVEALAARDGLDIGQLIFPLLLSMLGLYLMSLSIKCNSYIVNQRQLQK